MIDLVFSGVFAKDALVVWGASDANDKRSGVTEVFELMKKGFVLLGRQGFVGELSAAAGGDEQEGVKRGGANCFGEAQECLELMGVAASEGGIDLNRKVLTAKCGDTRKGGVKGAEAAAKVVVAGGVGTIERNGDGANTGVVDASSDVVVKAGAAKSNRGRQTESPGMIGQVEDVGSKQRFAAGEDHERVGERGNVIQQSDGLLRREFAGVRFVDSRGATMTTVQRAAAREFPGDDTRGRRC